MTKLSVDADLQISAEIPVGGSTQRIEGSITGSGSRVEVALDSLPRLKTGTARALVNVVGRLAADRGLQIAVRGPDGTVAVVGDVKAGLAGRLIFGSRYVRPGRLGALLAILRASRSGDGVRLVDLLPPTTPLPVTPTLGVDAHQVTTTHDPAGGGRPRVFFPGQVNRLPGDQTQVFYLRVGATTSVGSDPGSDLYLEGIAPRHASFERDEWDEYWVVGVASDPVFVNGQRVQRSRLRTGARIELGRWTMVYFRAEYADHGRPYGGRVGGEAGHQLPQDMPDYRNPGRTL